MLSIITINLNNLAGLRKTVESVFNQSYQDWEFLIIDGGSIDGSIEFTKQNNNRLSYFISEKDKGVYHAINKGIKASKGTFLMFLNSGDYLLHKDVLHEGVQKISTLLDADVYYGDIEIMGKEGIERINYYDKPTMGYWRDGNINHQAAFYKKDLFIELGLYDPEFKLAADQAFNIKAFSHGKRFQHLGITMVHYDVNGQSSKNFQLYKREMKKAYEKLLPAHVREIILEHEMYQNLFKQTIIKNAVKLNTLYHNIRFALKRKR